MDIMAYKDEHDLQDFRFYNACGSFPFVTIMISDIYDE
jgi:hypothetical protein